MHGFDGDRQAVLLGEAHDLRGIMHGHDGAGGHGRADLGRDAPRLDLVAEDADGVRAWPDPDESGVEHGLGELGVLGEEPVAGVDGVGVRFSGDGDDRVDVEIGLRRRGAGQRVCLVGEPDEQRVRVGVGVDGDGLASAVMAGVDDAHRDLAAVGDQYSFHIHCSLQSLRYSRNRMRTPGWSWPASARACSVSTAMTGYPPVTG